MKIKLKITTPKGATVSEFKDVTQVLVGRSKAQIILEDERCSRAHCILVEASDGELMVRDLDSSNGTFFQDKKIKEAVLKAGDQIQIGRTFISIIDFGPSAKSNSQDRTAHTQADVISDWANMLRAMPTGNVENFLDYMDEDQKKKSVRLNDLEKKRKKSGK